MRRLSTLLLLALLAVAGCETEDPLSPVTPPESPPNPPFAELGSSGAICYPLAPTIELTLEEEPIHNCFDRYLTFINHSGSIKRLRVSFRRKSGLTWEADSFPEGIGVLESLADTDNRGHWDDMRLENRGGTTTLEIAHLLIVMHYDISSSYEEDIPVVDYDIHSTLNSGYSSILLRTYANISRRTWAGVDLTMHDAVRLAAYDLGKSGSDGTDRYGLNPKYGDRVDYLCSEFVSWYYYESGLVIGGENFRDITGTAQIDEAFERARRRYDYRNDRQGFYNYHTGTEYTPQPGDFLARRYGGEYEHSMMVLRWDDHTKIMTVINGPWPVTLRYVDIQTMEESGYDFRVGRID